MMENWYGNTVKMLRKDSKVTQTVIAKRVNTSQKHLSRIENGNVEPGIDLADRILNCFDYELVAVKRRTSGGN